MRGVALGGGHGTAVALQALNLFCDDVTGIVSVADNGGSSGELRRVLDIAAVGDLRRCLSATGDPSRPLTSLLESRLGRGQHPLGNLLLAMAVIEFGSLERAVTRVATMVGSTVRLLPATGEKVDLRAETPSGTVNGQVDVHGRSDILTVSLVPHSPFVPPSVREALLGADLIVAGPGSFFTSVLATLVVPGVLEAISASSARFIFIANLRPEIPESVRLGLPGQLQALQEHGITPDVVLCDNQSDWRSVQTAKPVVASLADASGVAHDPHKIARALTALMAN